MTHFKKISLAGILAAGLAFVGCLGEDTAPVPTVTLKVSTVVDGVNASEGGLSKANLITLNKLIVVLTSNATVPDTVRDTILVGQNGFSATSTAQQTVTKNYTVKGLRTWTINATVKDSRDSVIHSGSAVTANFVKVADTASVSLSMASKFLMYEAIFANLPDSITTSSGTGHKQTVSYKRLVLKINGVTVRDSTSPTFFTKGSGSSHSLAYDYVAVTGTPTTHNIRLIAYGSVGATYQDSIFAGNTTILAVQNNGADSSKSVSLSWVGPNTGTESVSVTIGKVGKNTVTGTPTCGSGCVPKRK
jgi:hypothetical protein